MTSISRAWFTSPVAAVVVIHFVRLLLLAERDGDEEKDEEQVKEDACDAEEVNDSW